MEKFIFKMENLSKKNKHTFFYLILILVLSSIIYLHIPNYLFIHSLVQLIIAIIGTCSFIIVCNTYKICENNYFLFIGIAYGFISLFTVMSVVEYKPNIGRIMYLDNISLDIFTFRAYTEGISLLLAFRYLKKDFEIKKGLLNYISLTIIFILLLKFNIIPNEINEYGEVNFLYYFNKIILYSINIIVLIKFLKCKKLFNDKIFKLMINFIFFKIISNSCFIIFHMFLIANYSVNKLDNLFTIFYVLIKHSYFFNVLGHVFKVFAYLLLYRAIIQTVLKDPLNILFNNLKAKNDRLNKQNFKLEFAKAKEEKTKRGYKKLLEVIPEGIMVIKSSTIEYVNQGMIRLLELESEQMLIGKDIKTLLGCKGKSRLYKKIERLQRKNKFIFLEEEFIRNDNVKIYVEMTSIPIEINNEKYTLYLIKDTTQRKRAEQIEKILEIEKLADKFKTEFFSNLSHELKTPINIIYSTIQLNDIYIDKEDIKSIKKYNDIIKKNCFRLIRLTNNLIDMTEISEGILTPKFKIYNIVSIVENTTSAVHSYIKDKNIDIIFDTEVEEKYVLCDPDLIERIILNLLSNSVKYGKRHTLIKVNVYDNKQSVLISVKDNGIGIPEDKQNAIFSAFMQGDKSLNRNTEGSGIGLTIAKALAELHGGDISLISIEGEGSEFIVTLPANQAIEEACADTEEELVSSNILNKVYVEFSDIYF